MSEEVKPLIVCDCGRESILIEEVACSICRRESPSNELAFYDSMMKTFDQRFVREDYPVPSWSINYNRGTWLQWEGMAAGGGFRIVNPVKSGVIPTAIVCHNMNDVAGILRLIR